MRGYEVGQVHIGRLLYATDEADRFREGDSAREGLCKAAVARELLEAILRELVRAEIVRIVLQAGLAGRDHLIHVVGMVRVIVDDVHGAVRPVVDVAF